MMQIVLAIVIGGAFGAVLDRVGATNPSVLGRMLSLRALGLMKAILLAIGVASILIFGGQMLGIVDVAHMSVKAANAGVLIGGALLGAGWALAGYCPGTGLGAAASGRIDAMVFVLGGLAGALAYTFAYPLVKSMGLLDDLFGGKVTLAPVPGAKYEGLYQGMSGDMLGLILGAVFVVVAFVIPSRERRAPASATPAE